MLSVALFFGLHAILASFMLLLCVIQNKRDAQEYIFSLKIRQLLAHPDMQAVCDVLPNLTMVRRGTERLTNSCDCEVSVLRPGAQVVSILVFLLYCL